MRHNHPPGWEADVALSELREGRPALATMDLLRRVLRAVVGRHSYPHPDPDMSWRDQGAYDAAISVFFADKDGQRRLDDLAVTATSDRHLRALLITTVKNWFRDLARATPQGRLHRSVRRTLREEDEVFEEVPPP